MKTQLSTKVEQNILDDFRRAIVNKYGTLRLNLQKETEFALLDRTTHLNNEVD